MTFCSFVSAVRDGPWRGLIVQHDAFGVASFYELQSKERGKPRLERRGRLESTSAVMSLSDQAWPCLCDWDGDGDQDLLVGGGYGWPRITLNTGSLDKPAFAEPQPILAEGKPIRMLRDGILHSRNWHNMGYSYPVFVDWDGDGLKDLMLPNETNRIIWYKNVGQVEEPRFGTRRFLTVEGYPDSSERRAETGRLADDKRSPNAPYPPEARPFFWRTGAAFADFDGNGSVDLITHHGQKRKATLYVQMRSADGKRRLRDAGPVKLTDGRLIDDAIVGRRKHWTESFRAADWNADGLHDLVYSLAGKSGDTIYLLKNVGTKTKPVFATPRAMRCFGEPICITAHGPHPWAGDLDGDGRPDLLACVEWSVYPFYRYAAIEMARRPDFEVGKVVRRNIEQ